MKQCKIALESYFIINFTAAYLLPPYFIESLDLREVCMCLQNNRRTYTETHIYICICMCVSVYVCACVCAYMCMVACFS